MRSLIHLYNTALAQLGGEQIPLNISPIEDDTNGAICQNLFPHVLEAALVAHNWGFARRRVILALAQEETPESLTYVFRYRLPEDCVRPVRIVNRQRGAVSPDEVNRSPEYVIEGLHILCNVEQAELLYVARIDEPTRWPAYFADVLMWKMAANLATAKNNDQKQKQMCEQMYEYALAKGCAIDRAAQNPQRPASPWQVARHKGRAADMRWRS